MENEERAVPEEVTTEEKKELFNTYGFDIRAVILDARANGNAAFAEVVEKCIGNLQECYDIIAQKHTSTGGENIWNIDAEVLKSRLK